MKYKICKQKYKHLEVMKLENSCFIVVNLCAYRSQRLLNLLQLWIVGLAGRNRVKGWGVEIWSTRGLKVAESGGGVTQSQRRPELRRQQQRSVTRNTILQYNGANPASRRARLYQLARFWLLPPTMLCMCCIQRKPSPTTLPELPPTASTIRT